MARRRVLALGPAVSRMMCMRHPYQKIKSDEAKPKRLWSWRRKKALKLGGDKKSKRRWRVRVGRLRIRLLSPLALLQRLADAYVRMMFSLESKMGGAGLVQCSTGPIYTVYPMHIPGRTGL